MTDDNLDRLIAAIDRLAEALKDARAKPEPEPPADTGPTTAVAVGLAASLTEALNEATRGTYLENALPPSVTPHIVNVNEGGA